MIGGRRNVGSGRGGGCRRLLNSSAASRAARPDTGFSYGGAVPPGGIRNGGSTAGGGGTVGVGIVGGGTGIVGVVIAVNTSRKNGPNVR